MSDIGIRRGQKEYPLASVSHGVLYSLINYYSKSKEHLEVLKIYSHNLHFKLTGLTRFFYRDCQQDTLLLHNPKECRGEKKLVLSSSLRIPDPSLLGDPWTYLTCLGNDSLKSWTIQKAEPPITDVFEMWCWRRLLRIP